MRAWPPSRRTFRSGDDFCDQFSSTGKRFSWRSSRSFGCLGIIRSSEGTHGHGEAPGEAPARENAKTGRSPDVGLLDSRKWTPSWIGFCSWGGLKQGLEASWGLLVAIFRCAYKNRGVQTKPQGRRPLFSLPRSKHRSKMEAIFLSQEDLNSENVPISRFPWLAPLLGPSRGHECLQRLGR